MPEGDTVYKLAAELRPRLLGRPLRRVWMRECGEVAPLVGGRVGEIATLGKHLQLAVTPPRAHGQSDDRVLHVHLGMGGRWRRADPWARVLPSARLALQTDGDLFLCARAGTVELLRRLELRDHPRLARLGPDLMRTPFPLDEAVRRARARAPRSLGELLLDQTIACGLGNAFKSDVLFLEGLHPETPPDAVDDAALRALFARAHRLMRWNRRGRRRVTTRPVGPDAPLARGESGHWVYERARLPCLRCGTPIAGARQGDAARATFWCARCQPRAPAAAPRPADGE